MNDKASVAATFISSVATALQADQVLYYIQLVISILCGLFTLLTMLTNWYHKAKQDGKITKEEIKEGLDIAHDEINNIIENIKDKGEDKDETKH